MEVVLVCLVVLVVGVMLWAMLPDVAKGAVLLIMLGLLALVGVGILGGILWVVAIFTAPASKMAVDPLGTFSNEFVIPMGAVMIVGGVFKLVHCLYWNWKDKREHEQGVLAARRRFGLDKVEKYAKK